MSQEQEPGARRPGMSIRLSFRPHAVGRATMPCACAALRFKLVVM